MANNFGINPVSGGNPANEINIIDSINWVVGEIIEIFISCFVVVVFIEFITINSGIINEQ
jgi:hypothetical protein